MGGIAGACMATAITDSSLIENCQNYATLTISTGGIGGIVGTMQYGTVKNCLNAGTFFANFGNSGAVSFAGIIAAAGGIVTLHNNINIANIVYNGMNENVFLAGIVSGFMDGGSPDENITMSNCINLGSIVNNSQNARVGGILGIITRNPDVVISNCINYGFVKGKAEAGGLIGIIDNTVNRLTIIDCLNTGVIEGVTNVGAIVGETNSNVTISNCHYDKQMCIYGGVNGVDIPGQAEGHLTRNMVGTKLQALLGTINWTYTDAPKLIDRLYPQLKALDQTEASKVGAAPVFLWDDIEGDD